MRINNCVRISVALFSIFLMSFQFPKNIQKKVDKEIRISFAIENFSLNTVQIPSKILKELSAKIESKNFYKITAGDIFLGYVFVDKAPSKTAQFDYMILLDAELNIAKTKILYYREDHGGEISSKRWLKEFIGKNKEDKLLYGRDIAAISGATISANSMTLAVNNFLSSIKILHTNKII